MAEGVGDHAGLANGGSDEHGVLGDSVAAVGPLTAARAAVAAANTAMEAVGEQREREPPVRELTPPKQIRAESGDRGREGLELAQSGTVGGSIASGSGVAFAPVRIGAQRDASPRLRLGPFFSGSFEAGRVLPEGVHVGPAGDGSGGVGRLALPTRPPAVAVNAAAAELAAEGAAEGVVLAEEAPGVPIKFPESCEFCEHDESGLERRRRRQFTETFRCAYRVRSGAVYRGRFWCLEHGSLL